MARGWCGWEGERLFQIQNDFFVGRIGSGGVELLLTKDRKMKNGG